MNSIEGIPNRLSEAAKSSKVLLQDANTRWKRSLAEAVRSVETLATRLQLPESVVQQAQAAKEAFPVMVTESYLSKMQKNDPHDPLLRQILPWDEEMKPVAGFHSDAVGDQNALQTSGLIHKYHGRALLILTGACAVHCRYCFRRHFPYSDQPHSLEQWRPALEQIQRDDSLTEIILSGGDPLLITDERIEQMLNALETIPHIKRVRIHSRLPIVLPNRITKHLLQLFSESRLSVIMVVHANHAAELVDDTADALRNLVAQGIPTLNQSVLLKGVNDSVGALTMLSERLINLGVIPYYLHQLDRVEGAAHFEVPIERGQELMRAIQQQLPGYAVPRYVQEIPGELSKQIISY